MDYVIGWIRTKPGLRTSFTAASSSFVSATRAESGVLFFELIPSDSDPDVVVAIEGYTTAAAHEAHVKSVHFADFWVLFQSHVIDGRFENITAATVRTDVVRP